MASWRLWIVVVFACVSGVHAGTMYVCTSGDSDGTAYWDLSLGSAGKDVADLSALSAPAQYSSMYWKQAVFEFPVSTLSGFSGLAATFSVTINAAPTTNAYVRYYGDGDGEVSWLNYKDTGTAQALLSSGTTGLFTCNVTNAVQDAANNGHDWLVLAIVFTNNGTANYALSEAGWSTVPYLCITGDNVPDIPLVPEPACLLLLALGGVIVKKRRH